MPPGCSGDISPGRRSWPSLCLEAGNPIIGPGGRYWALASQNACTRQLIRTKNPLSQRVVCSDNQVQSMDEALDKLGQFMLSRESRHVRRSNGIPLLQLPLSNGGADSNFISNEFAISHGFNILPLAPPDIAAFKSVGGTIIPKHCVALRVSLPGLGSPEREISFRVIPAGHSEMRDAAILGARGIFKNGLLKSSTASLDLVEPIFEQQESDLTIAEQSDMPGINSPVVDQFSDSDHSSRSPRSSTMMSVMNPVSSKSSVEPRPIRKLTMDNLQSLENRIQDIETEIESVPSEASDGFSSGRNTINLHSHKSPGDSNKAYCERVY